MNDLTTAPPGIIFVSPEWGRLPVTNMLDVDREETTDPTLACVVVAILPDGRWLAAELKPGDELHQMGLS